MGLLAHIFVAAPQDAALYQSRLRSRAPMPAPFERLEYGGLTGLEFGALWALLAGQEWDLDAHELEELPIPGQIEDSGDTWLLRFPAPFVRLLARTEDAQLAPLSEAWGKIDELDSPGAELVPVLTDLRRYARVAEAAGYGLYLWGSL